MMLMMMMMMIRMMMIMRMMLRITMIMMRRMMMSAWLTRFLRHTRVHLILQHLVGDTHRAHHLPRHRVSEAKKSEPAQVAREEKRGERGATG
jgi:hypothetical protein